MPTVHVQLAGRLDRTANLELRRSIGQAIEQCDRGTVVLDFAQVAAVDDDGIATLRHCLGRAESADATLTIKGASPRVAEWLDLCGVAEVFGLAGRGGPARDA